MEEENVVDVEIKNTGDESAVTVEVVEPAPEAAAEPGPPTTDAQKDAAKKDKPSTTIREALKQAETFAQTLGEALQGRGNVVMVRVNDEALAHLDMLVEAEVTKSRSESAAFLINEGIRANEELFVSISSITDKIAALREQLRKEVKLPSQTPEAATDTSGKSSKKA